MGTPLAELSAAVGAALKSRGWLLATAESCTGGWVAQTVTATAGSSDWFERGFVTYSNAAKRELLGVSEATLRKFGAVSEEAAAEMAAGALKNSPVQVALAITGIAGPGGGSKDKPVGTVCFAWCGKDGTRRTATRHFSGDREAVRRLSVVFALTNLIELLKIC